MADEFAATGLARLAGMLRAEATNGIFWGAPEDELDRLRRIRRFAAALTAELDHRPASAVEAVFDQDRDLRTPAPGTEIRISCADGETLVQRRRLGRDERTLRQRLQIVAQVLETEPLTEVLGFADTDLAGLPCPQTSLLVYETATRLTSAEVSDRLDASEDDLVGAVTLLAPEASAVTPDRGRLPVSATVKEILDEVVALAKEGRAATSSFYVLERHQRIEELCESTVEAEVVYPELDCGDLAAPCLPTGAEAAVFDERGRVLMIRRTDTGQWAIPGGAGEVGETVGTAAVREVLEETGLKVSLTGLVGAFDNRESAYTDMRMPMIVTFMARADVPEQPLRPAELEASEARWFGPDEIEGLDFFRGHQIRVPAAFAARERGVGTGG